MATQTFSVPNIRAAWPESSVCIGVPRWPLIFLSLALCPLLPAQPPEARLGRAIDKFEAGKFADALLDLKAAQPKLPKIADYTAYYLAAARIELKHFA